MPNAFMLGTKRFRGLNSPPSGLKAGLHRNTVTRAVCLKKYRRRETSRSGVFHVEHCEGGGQHEREFGRKPLAEQPTGPKP
jgi:hypothetical protein